VVSLLFRRVLLRLNKWQTQLHTQPDQMYVPAAANNNGVPWGKKGEKRMVQLFTLSILQI
jgi:hypothetical protein